MKRYLSAIFVGLSIVAVIISYRIDVYWNGIVAWSLAFILLCLATYFTKYIRNNTFGGADMKYFVVFLPMKDEDKSTKYRQEHLDFLAEQREKNRVFMYGKLTDGAGGLIIYQGADLEEVEAFAKEDPYVVLGARGFEIHEWEMQTDYNIS